MTGSLRTSCKCRGLNGINYELGKENLNYTFEMTKAVWNRSGVAELENIWISSRDEITIYETRNQLIPEGDLYYRLLSDCVHPCPDGMDVASNKFIPIVGAVWGSEGACAPLRFWISLFKVDKTASLLALHYIKWNHFLIGFHWEREAPWKNAPPPLVSVLHFWFQDGLITLVACSRYVLQVYYPIVRSLFTSWNVSFPNHSTAFYYFRCPQLVGELS